MKKIEFREDIQLLRGVAILLVLGYHLGFDAFKNGFLGVDIFFVISGFLMAQIYQNMSVREYFKRRAFRLLPSYFATIALTIATGVFFLAPSDFRQTLVQALFSTVFLPNIYFWSRNSYFHSSDFNPLLHLWSLGIEIQFYILIPLFALLFSKSITILRIIVTISLASSSVIIMISPKSVFFLLPFRLWEFLFGFLAAKYIITYQRKLISRKREKLSQLLFFASIFLTLYILFFFPINGNSVSFLKGHPGVCSIMVAISTVLFILNRANIPLNFLTKALRLIGDYSYSLYLVHFPIIVYLNYRPFGGTKLGFENFKITLVAIILIWLMTWMIHKKIEIPFRYNKGLRIHLSQIVSIMALLGLATSSTHFNSLQFSEDQKKISFATLNKDFYRCGKLVRVKNPFEEICQLVEVGTDHQGGVLLLGNSHADSIKRAMMEQSKANDVPLYFWVQNDPLMYNKSDVIRVSEKIAKFKIKFAVLHYTEGAVSEEILLEFIDKLESIGTKVIVIGPVPTWSESVPILMWNAKATDRYLTQTYSDFRSLHPQLSFFELLALERRISFYDIGRYLCQDSCKFADKDGIPIYFDSNHLNLNGANLIQPFINEIFRDEITREGG